MGSRTYFNCDNVQFSATDRGNSLSVDDEWQPAKVYVTEFTDDTRWLFVSTNVEEAPPVIFRVIKEGWDLQCDERSLTMGMHKGEADVFSTVHKLRFVSRRDFWGFVAHMAYGRLKSYDIVSAAGWTDVSGTQAVQTFPESLIPPAAS